MIIHSKNHQYHARRKEIIGYPKKKIITKTTPNKGYRRRYPLVDWKGSAGYLQYKGFRNKLRKYRKYQT